MRVLVVEDEPLILNAICKILQDEGYETDAVENGSDAVYYIKEESYDLVILDIMLPGMDGISVLQRVRQSKINTPILMLTAKNTVAYKVCGLNTGADDYMTKPFDAAELLARVGALTRRKGAIVMNDLDYGDLRLDLNTAMLHRGDQSMQLTKREFEVLKILFQNPGITVTKESLIIHVWGSDSDTTENNVEAYISFLRKKMKYLSSHVRIKNIQGLGYRLEENHAEKI